MERLWATAQPSRPFIKRERSEPVSHLSTLLDKEKASEF
jgi:hypothetical protein